MRLLPVGQIMSASALLASNPNPTDADIDEAMSGNICRCGTYILQQPAVDMIALMVPSSSKGLLHQKGHR